MEAKKPGTTRSIFIILGIGLTALALTILAYAVYCFLNHTDGLKELAAQAMSILGTLLGGVGVYLFTRKEGE